MLGHCSCNCSVCMSHVKEMDWPSGRNHLMKSYRSRYQRVLNPTPLNPTPATCPKRKRKLRCNFWSAALQQLHCNVGFSAVRMSCWPKAVLQQAKNCSATLEKVRCKKVALSCGFQAPTFRHPRLGPAEDISASMSRQAQVGREGKYGHTCTRYVEVRSTDSDTGTLQACACTHMHITRSNARDYRAAHTWWRWWWWWWWWRWRRWWWVWERMPTLRVPATTSSRSSSCWSSFGYPLHSHLLMHRSFNDGHQEHGLPWVINIKLP